MRIIALLCLCFAAVSAARADHQRIVGGSVTTINQYPTIAALLYSWDLTTYWQSCGGSILNNRAVLTAAHCTTGDAANRWRFRLGSTFANSGGTVYAVNTIINHPNHNSANQDNDIAIVRTSSTIVFNNVVQPVSIAGANYNLGDNQPVWAAGWGAIYSGGPFSEQLRHVQVYTINQAECAARYATANWPITANMLCSGVLNVGGRDQCQNDSGGPLYHNNIQVGICSFGIGCADAFFPGVNARVSRYTAWIQANA